VPSRAHSVLGNFDDPNCPTHLEELEASDSTLGSIIFS